MHELWTEKYRPKTIKEYVFKDSHQKDQILKWIKEKTIPELIFSGGPGTGKTTLAKVLFNELDINPLDVLEINASRTNSIDDVRNKIVNFIQMIPFGDFKVVLLDECLDENTEVVILRKNKEELIKIKDLDDTSDLVKTYNIDLQQIEWKEFSLFDKGNQETITIEFENGELVTCTLDHKWYVEDNAGNPIIVKASDLENYSYILTT